MTETHNTKFDLEERTFIFARDCRDFTKIIPKSLSSLKYSDQLIRASGSVAGNYIEANESLSRKDFCHRIKICRKEAKESKLWLRLIETNANKAESERLRLINEAEQLMKIFGSILEKSK
jgi:four helix bundle protein